MNKRFLIIASIVLIIAVIVASVFVVNSFIVWTKTGTTPLSVTNSFPASPVVPHSTPIITPVLSDVYLNRSSGFKSSLLVTAGSGSPLYVLTPGRTGTIPFTVYSYTNVSFTASFSTYLGSPNATDYGLSFSFSPSSFTVNPGEHVPAVVTITAGNSTQPVFYLGSIQIDTDKEQSPYYIGAGSVNMPSLLVANYTPQCIYFINGFEFAPPVIIPAQSNTGRISKLAGLPTINMSAGEETQFIFCSSNQEKLSINATAQLGISAEFQQTPLDIILSYTAERKMYGLNLKADPRISPGTYNANLKGSIDIYQFEGTLNIQIK